MTGYFLSEPDPTDFEPAEYPRRHRWRLITSVLLIVVVVAFIALPLVEDGILPGPGAGTSLPRGVAARIRLIESQTSVIRGLKPLYHVHVNLLSSSAFTKRIGAIFARGDTPSYLKIADEEAVLSGLIPPKTNLAGVLNQSLPSQVAGWYDFKTKQLFIRGTGQAVGIDRWAIAHEFTHALQDQHFGLGHVQPDQSHWALKNSDEYMAEHSLVEGDAVHVENTYIEDDYSQPQQQALFRQQQSIPSAPAPRAIQEQFQFPYVDGPAYIEYLLTAGGYAAVNFAFRHPPRTTFQVMFPGQVIHPQHLSMRGLSGPFRNWKTADDDVDGAFGYEQLLEQYVSTQQASDLAKLWRGDRYMLLRRGHRYAMFMKSVYANPSAARTAFRIIETSLATRFGLLSTLRSEGVWGGSQHHFGAVRLRGRVVLLGFGTAPAVVHELVMSRTR